MKPVYRIATTDMHGHRVYVGRFQNLTSDPDGFYVYKFDNAASALKTLTFILETFSPTYSMMVVSLDE